MYKSLHNLAPSYMSNKFTYSYDIHNLDLRSTTNQTLHIPKPKLEIYRKLLSYSGPKLWNALPESVRRVIQTEVLKTTKCECHLNYM